jgi:hypothetical protein
MAAAYFQMGQTEEAIQLLENGIIEKDFSIDIQESMYYQLDGYKEALIEEQFRDGKLEYKVQRSYNPIAIDGEINDWWLRSDKITLSGPRHIWSIQKKFHRKNMWAGDEDLRGDLYFSWDSEYFYFLFKIYDTNLKAYDGENEKWIGDCLLIALDFDGNGGYTYRPGDTVLSLALQAPKKKNKQQQEEEKKTRPQGKYFVKRTADEQATIYEVALPWSMFKQGGAFLDTEKGPEPGFTFGINLVVTDDDGADKTAGKSLNLTPGMLLHEEKSKLWYNFVPNYFARIRLVK